MNENSTHPLHTVGRLPKPEDNVAIATRRIEAGTRVTDNTGGFSISHTVMEGHRFAMRPIPAGEPVLSWGLPFGVAIRDIAPGDYVCNGEILDALRVRNLEFPLPESPNFKDVMNPYRLDAERFTPGEQIPLSATPLTFMGYRRGAGRGVGVRNDILLLGTTSQTAGYVKRLEDRLRGTAVRYAHIDDIVAVAHTEGGTPHTPNNRDLLLRTLAGFMIHSNVGAVLAVDYGTEAVTNDLLRTYMEEYGYPFQDVPHRFLSLEGSFEQELDRGEGIVRAWMDTVNSTPRTEESASHLKIALQCGGSDAFSGISGNPLAAWVAREIIRSGGAANLAETDELIGAESYVLQNARDLDTAQKFLMMVERFKERTAWHGQTVDANPSGGNKFRGIYNIVLKSIGAARKRHPDIRLDYAIEYGAPMRQPGYYFMDSPGNDLESIAGQIASGCNMIFFITGNGSITNFPFAPTIKIVTTTKRYELLSADMDINAGAYLDGASMDDLGQQMLDLTLRVASGTRTCGEQAGHAQVSIWRDWKQTDRSRLPQLLNRPLPKGVPLPLKASSEITQDTTRIRVFRTNGHYATDRLGLILPTSLCSGQIARMTAERLNQKGLGREQGLSRYVALAHTEGCGVSGGPSEELYARTMVGYLTHPLVLCGLLLEHGCERTHNDYYRQQLRKNGIDMNRFGWASIQLDGGIDKVMARIEGWFASTLAHTVAPAAEEHGIGAIRLGLLTAGPVSEDLAGSLAQATRMIVHAGGTVVIPDHAELLTMAAYGDALLDRNGAPTLAYGQPAAQPGLHIMETQTEHWVETLTGLGATGVEVMLSGVSGHPMQGHPMIPLVQVSASGEGSCYREDMDLILDGNSASWPHRLLQMIGEVASRRYVPKPVTLGNMDFQVTRGLLGVSM